MGSTFTLAADLKDEISISVPSFACFASLSAAYDKQSFFIISLMMSHNSSLKRAILQRKAKMNDFLLNVFKFLSSCFPKNVAYL